MFNERKFGHLYPSTENLVQAIKEAGDSIIVDVGCGGHVSTTLEQGLLVLIDPNLDPNKLDWGDNYANFDNGAKVVAVKGTAWTVRDLMNNLAERVQMVAPDPDRVEDMLEESFDMVKAGGKAVLIFDINSNKEEKVAGVIDDISRKYHFHKVREFDPDEYDPSDFVEGEINSSIIPGSCRILVITKRF